MKSAVAAGYGVAFISRSAIEGELAAGTLAAARVEGLEPARQIYLVRVHRVREGTPGVIVKWGLGELPRLLSEIGSKQPLLVTSERWRELELPVEHAFYGARKLAPVLLSSPQLGETFIRDLVGSSAAP